MKKSIIKSIVFIGFALTVLGLIIDCVIEEKVATYALSTYVVYVAVATILGTVFVFSKNATLSNVGYGLCAFVGALGIILFIKEADLTVTQIGLTILFIGSVLKFLLIVIQFFGFFRSEGKTVSNISDVLTQYKELEKEKVISAEEFNDLKNKVIATNEKENISLEDLKKWKKLLDQNVITEAEYAEMKAKMFAK